jgi:hypothetical protein
MSNRLPAHRSLAGCGQSCRALLQIGLHALEMRFILDRFLVHLHHGLLLNPA